MRPICRHYWYLAGLEEPLTRYLRCFYGACREVYVPSASMREALLADGLKDNFRPWPRGIDTARFHPAKRSTAWRARHGIGAERDWWCCMSRGWCGKSGWIP